MEWRTIQEAPFYVVSSEGHVKSCYRKIPMWNGLNWCEKTINETYPLKEKDIRGYKNVSIIQYDSNMHPIKRYMKQVHRLVLFAFSPIENSQELQVNHINGIKNDNRLENLEWVTCKENVAHSTNIGKGHQMNQNGESNSMSKLTNEDVLKIIQDTNKKNRKTDQKLAEKYGVTRKTISNIRLGLTWKHLSASQS